jgi:DNA-binding NarL/FixJ family response regulator
MLIALPDRNKNVVRRVTRELFNEGGDASAAQALMAPDFVDHGSPAVADAGRRGYVRRALALRESTDGLRTECELLVAEGDVVCERFRRSYRQGGRPVVEVGFAQYRLRDGLVTEVWGQCAASVAPAAADELTARELKVAVLVAEGRTNPEVGVELALSRKTVEAHLSAIYRKLGLRSRMELARMLAPHLDWARAA